MYDCCPRRQGAGRSRKVNIRVVVLEVEGTNTIKAKKGLDPGKATSILKMILGDEKECVGLRCGAIWQSCDEGMDRAQIRPRQRGWETLSTLKVSRAHSFCDQIKILDTSEFNPPPRMSAHFIITPNRSRELLWTLPPHYLYSRRPFSTYTRNNPCPCIHSHFDAHSLPLQYVPFPVSSSTTAHCQVHALMLALDKVTLPYDASGASKDSLRTSPGLVVRKNGTRRGLEVNWGLSAPLCILDLCGSV